MIDTTDPHERYAHYVKLGPGRYKALLSPKGSREFYDVRERGDGYTLEDGPIAIFEDRAKASRAVQSIRS